MLKTLGDLRRAGELPPSLVLKTSVLLPCANSATARDARGARRHDDQRLDRPLARRARRARWRRARRRSTSTSRSPDDQGGFVRFYEVPEIVRLAAPVYVKLGLRNAPNIYPSGLHLEDLAVKLGRERVRRAELVLRLLGGAGTGARRGSGRRPTARPRDPRAVRERFAAVYTAALADILDAARAARADPSTSIRPLGRGTRVAGPAYTVKGRPPTRTHDVRRSDPEVLAMLGDVPKATSPCTACDHDVAAHLGELSVTSLKARGVAGCVLDGGCRDVGFILEEGFPVFCRFVTPEDSTWRWGLRTDAEVTVMIGNVRIEPGDWMVGDDDGVVVVPRAVAEDVLAEAEQKAASRVRFARRAGGDAPARSVRALRYVLRALVLAGEADQDSRRGSSRCSRCR